MNSYSRILYFTTVLSCAVFTEYTHAASVSIPSKKGETKIVQKDEAPNNIKIDVKKINIPIERMDASLMYNDKIYIFSRKNWQIYEFEPCRNSFKSVAKLTPMDVPSATFRSALVMGMDNKYFVFGGTREIHVIKRDNRKEYIIKDLPSESVNAVTVMDGRIYAFTGRDGRGGNNSPQESILFSCLPDGSDRRTHISTARTEKSTSFDKLKPFCVNLLSADVQKKRLLFLCARPADGLYEFYPETGEEKKLIELKYSSSPWGMQIDSMLYIAGGGGNDFYYTFDMEANKADLIFYRRNETKDLKIKPVAASDIPVRAPFFTKNDQIWFNSLKLTYSELSNINDYSQPPDVKGIDFYNPIYPFPGEKSVLLITNNDIYKMTPNKYKSKH